MPLGTRHDLTGLLLKACGRPVLHPDEGGEWELEIDGHEHAYGTRIFVRGIRSGFNRIDVEHWGPAGR